MKDAEIHPSSNPSPQPTKSEIEKEPFYPPKENPFPVSIQKSNFHLSDLSWSHVGFMGGPVQKRQSYQVILFSWLAALIDTLILLSLSCFFLLCFGLIIQTPTGQVLRALVSHPSSIEFFTGVMLSASWFYMIFVRALIGATVGEWTCDLRMGSPLQRNHSSYIWRIMFRETLIVMTGVITIPLISLALRKDLAGSLSRVHLLSLK